MGQKRDGDKQRLGKGGGEDGSSRGGRGWRGCVCVCVGWNTASNLQSRVSLSGEPKKLYTKGVTVNGTQYLSTVGPDTYVSWGCRGWGGRSLPGSPDKAAAPLSPMFFHERKIILSQSSFYLLPLRPKLCEDRK